MCLELQCYHVACRHATRTVVVLMVHWYVLIQTGKAKNRACIYKLNAAQNACLPQILCAPIVFYWIET